MAEQPGIHIPSLPSSFNPLTATDAELKQYGFPRRPTDPTELAQWTTLMEHAKIFITPQFKILNRTTPTQNPKSSASITPSNLSYKDARDPELATMLPHAL